LLSHSGSKEGESAALCQQSVRDAWPAVRRDCASQSQRYFLALWGGAKRHGCCDWSTPFDDNVNSLGSLKHTSTLNDFILSANLVSDKQHHIF